MNCKDCRSSDSQTSRRLTIKEETHPPILFSAVRNEVHLDTTYRGKRDSEVREFDTRRTRSIAIDTHPPRAHQPAFETGRSSYISRAPFAELSCACDREAHSPLPKQTTAGGSRARWIYPIDRSIDQTKGPFLSDPPTSPTHDSPSRPSIPNRLFRHHPTPAHSIPPDRLREKSKEWNEVVDLKPRADFSGQTRKEREATTVTTSFHRPLCALVRPPLSPRIRPEKAPALSSFKGEEGVSVLITRSAKSP